MLYSGFSLKCFTCFIRLKVFCDALPLWFRNMCLLEPKLSCYESIPYFSQSSVQQFVQTGQNHTVVQPVPSAFVYMPFTHNCHFKSFMETDQSHKYHKMSPQIQMQYINWKTVRTESISKILTINYEAINSELKNKINV